MARLTAETKIFEGEFGLVTKGEAVASVHPDIKSPTAAAAAADGSSVGGDEHPAVRALFVVVVVVVTVGFAPPTVEIW